jgi:hypothetical protein
MIGTHLIQPPGNFAESAESRVANLMDVLSTVLNTVKLEGTMFYNAEFSAPWSLRSPASCLLAQYLSPEPRHVILYHLLTQGQACVVVEDGERVLLSAGDIVVFPHGDAHTMGNGRAVASRDYEGMLQDVLSQGLKPASMGGGGELTKFVCGYLTCDPHLSKAFLGGLPPVFKVKHWQRQLRPMAEELDPLLCRASRWLAGRKRDRRCKVVRSIIRGDAAALCGFFATWPHRMAGRSARS